MRPHFKITAGTPLAKGGEFPPFKKEGGGIFSSKLINGA
jgi:hypothetical protein